MQWFVSYKRHFLTFGNGATVPKSMEQEAKQKNKINAENGRLMAMVKFGANSLLFWVGVRCVACSFPGGGPPTHIVRIIL